MKKLWGMAAACVLTLLCSSSCLAGMEEQELNVVFTHDIHSHIDETVDENGNSLGGIARVRTVIKEQEAKTDAPLLVVDGGDFSMGTLFQTIYTSKASELRLLGKLGIEVTTFGNHEYDYRTDGVVSMLHAAKASGEKLPQLVNSNIIWKEDDAPDSDPYKLHQALEEYGGKNYTILQKGNIKVAVFGEFGKDAADCAPKSGQTFEDIKENAKRTVAQIRKEEVPDLIVCLSHSGTNSNSKMSEDEQLAKAVPDIDLIISGHTHTVLPEPIVVGDTTIASCGSYGRKVGTLKLRQNQEGRWKVSDYKLIDINDSIPEDAQIQAEIDSYEPDLNAYTSLFGYADRHEILAENPYEFADSEKQSLIHGEYPLATLLADSYIYRVEQAEGDYEPVDVAIVPSGVIRATLHQGDVTVANVFEVLSLGVGEDGVSGYPLVSMYLTGKELKNLAELDASVASIKPNYQLYFSGMKMTYNKNRLIFNRLVDAKLIDTNGRETEIEDKKLYRVVSDYYSAQMVGSAQEATKNIIQLTPRNADGSAITDMKKNIILENGAEVKAWEAAAAYLKSFSRENGVSVIPEYYSKV